MKDTCFGNVVVESDIMGDAVIVNNSTHDNVLYIGDISSGVAKNNASDIARCLIKSFDINLADLMGE